MFPYLAGHQEANSEGNGRGIVRQTLAVYRSHRNVNRVTWHGSFPESGLNGANEGSAGAGQKVHRQKDPNRAKVVVVGCNTKVVETRKRRNRLSWARKKFCRKQWRFTAGNGQGFWWLFSRQGTGVQSMDNPGIVIVFCLFVCLFWSRRRRLQV